MVLNGVVSNITAFGAFVDIGVHDDGLVHISQFPTAADGSRGKLKIGQRVRVKVIDVDYERGRISLSMKEIAQ